MEALIPLVLMLGLSWVLLIRPQQQRVRRQQALASSLTIGDRVITAGGIFGTVSAFDEESVVVEVAPNVEVRLLKFAIARKVEDGDL